MIFVLYFPSALKLLLNYYNYERFLILTNHLTIHRSSSSQKVSESCKRIASFYYKTLFTPAAGKWKRLLLDNSSPLALDICYRNLCLFPFGSRCSCGKILYWTQGRLHSSLPLSSWDSLALHYPIYFDLNKFFQSISVIPSIYIYLHTQSMEMLKQHILLLYSII